MAWDADSDAIVTLARERLLASSDTFSGTFTSPRCHTPKFDVLAANALPAALFQRSFYRAERHAPGESYGFFRVVVVLYVSTSVDVSDLEKMADTICNEVVAWDEEGLSITKCEAAMATDPSDAQKAAANDSSKGLKYRTITMVMEGEG